MHDEAKVDQGFFHMWILGENGFPNDAAILCDDGMTGEHEIRAALMGSGRSIYISAVTGTALLFYKFPPVFLFTDQFIGGRQIGYHVCSGQCGMRARLIRDP